MGLRTRLKSLIQNYEANANYAQDQFMRTGKTGFRQAMYSYIEKANHLKRMVLRSEAEKKMSEYNVLVVGNGFVGSTIADSITTYVNEVYRVDPAYYPDVEIRDYPNADCAIVAVPTPANEDGTCDDGIVQEVIDELMKRNPNIPILLKSTVTPDLMSKYPDNVVYCPEFLRANTAKEDYANQTTYILGANRAYEAEFWEDFFIFAKVDIEIVGRNTASMIKYMHNCWLATKVAFFHEIFDKAHGGYNYNDMIRILGSMENIGPSHMDFNEWRGLGFSGYCFPKDTKAFREYTGSEILSQVIETNENLLKKDNK